jgi:hypothetical protein
MTWERVVELLKIKIDRCDDRQYYRVKVYIPSFRTSLHMMLDRRDHEVLIQMSSITIEDIIKQKIIQQFQLETWLSTKIN